MKYKIQDIEGVGPSYGSRLVDAGITTTVDMLRLCCAPAGRRQVASATGLSESLILKWANLADLMRISGIGPQYAELLERVGVDTVKELRHRNAQNLAFSMKEINDRSHVAKRTPAVSVVESWISAARSTEPTISH
ncbi:MAG: DUF4332 domain-containing protein [Planctomycetota bacterium]|nr:DUF4332 domain-containing protein [Planctomycetota bacterium]